MVKLLKWLLSPILLLFVPIYYLCFLTKKYFDSKKQFKPQKTKIVCVGNYTLGGSGKTVVVKKLAEDLGILGKKVAIISRGYKRKKIETKDEGRKTKKIKTKNFMIILNPEENYDFDIVKYCGDEPFMLFKELKVPIVVDSNRPRAIKTLVEKFNPDIIISDDGYQNFSFFKDVNILVINMLASLSDKLLFPLGNLRERVKESILRARYVILNHCNLVDEFVINKTKTTLLNHKPDLKIIETYYKIRYLIKLIDNKKYDVKEFIIKNNNIVVLCTGIAKPETVQKMVSSEGFRIEEQIFYPDHYWFTKNDLIKLNSYKLPVILTQKDAVKIIVLQNELEDIYFENLYSIEVDLKLNRGKDLWDEMINLL